MCFWWDPFRHRMRYWNPLVLVGVHWLLKGLYRNILPDYSSTISQVFGWQADYHVKFIIQLDAMFHLYCFWVSFLICCSDRLCDQACCLCCEISFPFHISSYNGLNSAFRQLYAARLLTNWIKWDFFYHHLKPCSEYMNVEHRNPVTLIILTSTYNIQFITRRPIASYTWLLGSRSLGLLLSIPLCAKYHKSK